MMKTHLCVFLAFSSYWQCENRRHQYNQHTPLTFVSAYLEDERLMCFRWGTQSIIFDLGFARTPGGKMRVKHLQNQEFHKIAGWATFEHALQFLLIETPRHIHSRDVLRPASEVRVLRNQSYPKSSFVQVCRTQIHGQASRLSVHEGKDKTLPDGN